jgi:DNA-binding SARP family transcriptional activator
MAGRGLVPRRREAVVSTLINLLGPPHVDVEGVARPAPRGSKSWAVLAYLVLSRLPVPRSRLLDLLYEEADDPAAALRWNLSQLRRTLDGAADLTGDPVTWKVGARTAVDVDLLLHGSWRDALALPGFGGGLLEGVSPRTGAAFELWLSNERRRVAAATATTLHHAAHDRLAHGAPDAAADLAARLVACDPLEERGHELLVRALAAAGEHESAQDRVRECERLFASQLGRRPSPALGDALRSRSYAAPPQTRAAVVAAVDMGLAAAQAGAYDRAVELLRGAVAAAGAHGEEPSALAMSWLGTVLVHGVRGSDEEAVSLLQRSFVMAQGCGARAIAAHAAKELAYVETLRAHYPRMEGWVAEATALADDDERLLSWVALYAGMGRTDQADYASAASALGEAQQLARRSGERRVLAYALTGEGRLRLLRGDLAGARRALEAACAETRELGWTGFLPFPQALLGEVELLEGNLSAAEECLEHAYALSCQVGDPCWESYALRGRGLLAAARGDDEDASRLLAEASLVSHRTADTHDWVEGHCLDALAEFAVHRGHPTAAARVTDLEDFASRRGLRELTARAALYRTRLGQPGAREGLQLLLEDVDNPALARASRWPGAGAPRSRHPRAGAPEPAPPSRRP